MDAAHSRMMELLTRQSVLIERLRERAVKAEAERDVVMRALLRLTETVAAFTPDPEDADVAIAPLMFVAPKPPRRLTFAPKPCNNNEPYCREVFMPNSGSQQFCPKCQALRLSGYIKTGNDRRRSRRVEAAGV